MTRALHSARPARDCQRHDLPAAGLIFTRCCRRCWPLPRLCRKSYFSSHIQPFRVHYWIDYSDGKVFEEGSGLKGIPNIHCYLDTDKECGPDTQLLGDITSKLAPYKVGGLGDKRAFPRRSS